MQKLVQYKKRKKKGGGGGDLVFPSDGIRVSVQFVCEELEIA